jgi:Short repeat of unknown function (DUF308)
MSQSPIESTSLTLTVDTSKLSKSTITSIRVAFAIGGLLAVVLGILVLVWPHQTLGLVAILFGIYFLVIGLIRVFTGIFGQGISGGGRVLNIVLGILVFIVGVVAVKNPALTISFLGLLIGIAWIIEGIGAIVETSTDRSRWFGIIFGVISIIAGIVVLFLPTQTVVLFAIVGGIFLIVAGIIQFARAFTFGRAAKAV